MVNNISSNSRRLNSVQKRAALITLKFVIFMGFGGIMPQSTRVRVSHICVRRVPCWRGHSKSNDTQSVILHPHFACTCTRPRQCTWMSGVVVAAGHVRWIIQIPHENRGGTLDTKPRPAVQTACKCRLQMHPNAAPSPVMHIRIGLVVDINKH